MHHLFLIHGMGEHGTDTWAEDVLNKLKEVSKRYEFFENEDLEDHINFIPISYDELIEQILDQWRDNTGELSSFIAEHDIETGFDIASVHEWLDEEDSNVKSFFWTHVADVLIYRYFLSVQAHIRSHVAEQFVSGINEVLDNYPDNTTCSVLAHSLGTSVVHDSLHMLGKNMLTDNQSFQTRRNWFFENMYSLANVSRVLESDFAPYSSIIVPYTANTNSYFNKFFNFRHRFDPFTKVKQFNPNNWGDDFKHFTLNHYSDWNIHSYEHYLEHPKVHINMLAYMVQNSVSLQERDAAFEDYENNRFGGSLKCIGEVEQIVENDLKPLYNSIENNMSIKDLIPLLTKSYKIYNDIKTTVEECDEE